ncbi:iron-containing alcohol dehydrogenase [Aureimonas fodinaquatilis]|uniref:iron-containing alcohol dehydrogenase n=1 Tax=Aureimonas fodinaquatilis TaxID=2565783 RepID=UPI001FE5EAB7|nr:iron-containing alcohol dehydrogenase [Aureimonas fodinaquatilis]
MFGTFRSPRAVYFGVGQRVLAGPVASQRGHRVLICTDERLSGDVVMEELVNNLRASGLQTEVFDRTQPDVPLDCVASAAERARSFGPDCIIAIGGGSCLDLGKVTALLHSHGGRPQDYYGEFKVPGPTIPLIAMPTTAGTGSEVTPVAVLSDPDKTLKVGVSDPYIIPAVAICDPELTLTCPVGLTAVTAADALTHGIESFTAIQHPDTGRLALDRVFVGKNTMSDLTALKAIGLIYHALPGAVRDGSDLQLRSQLMYGAMLAGQAFANAGNAAAHALQYPIGSLTGTAHGVGVAVLMPYVMHYNLPSRIKEYGEIADAIGVGTPDQTPREKALAAVDGVASLFRSINIPLTLAELGFEENQIEWAAEQAMTAARLVVNNPVALTQADMALILRAAWEGNTRLLAN